MSNLRWFGLILGIAGFLSAFLFFRGKRWHKTSFILSSSAFLFLLLISINPDILNVLKDILSLEGIKYERLFSMIIITIPVMVLIIIGCIRKIESLNYNLDQIARAISINESNIKNVKLENDDKNIVILIPAFNEAQNLDLLLPNIPRVINEYNITVVVIDDGSTDNTGEVVKKHGALLIKSLMNRGQGSALRIGYDSMLKLGAKIGLTMDADLQHRPEDIKPLLLPILSGDYDVVIGSRRLGRNDDINFIRQIGNLFFNYVIGILIGKRLTDCSSGFKSFNIEKISQLKLFEDQFQSAEFLITARKNGLKIGEIPITVRERNFGKSKKGHDLVYGFKFGISIFKSWWR